MIKINWDNFDASALGAIRTRPAVHQLCVGGSLHNPMQLAHDCWAVPIQSLGVADEVAFLAMYVQDYAGGNVAVGVPEKTMVMGLMSNLVTAIVCITPEIASSPEAYERAAAPRLALANDVIACATGRRLMPFAVLIATRDRTYHRLSFSGRGTQTRISAIAQHGSPEMLSRVYRNAQTDERLRFVLSLFRDGVEEVDNRFRVARLFNVLECLASENKSGGIGARQAVRQLLGISPAPRQWVFDDKPYEFEIIEVAGRLRDKLFHGVPFRETDLNEQARPAFSLLATSHEVGDILADYCRAGIYDLAGGIGETEDVGAR